MSARLCALFTTLFANLTEYCPIRCCPPKTRYSVSPPSDTTSPALSSDSPSKPKYGPTNQGMKMGGGTKRGQKEEENMLAQG
jgi:hypothetical protein